MESYYDILGVKRDALQEDIKKAYRKLSMKHHPDRGGNKEIFQKINEAYQTLGDDSHRNTYNMQLDGNPLAGLFGGDGDPSGIFNMFFGGQMPMGNPQVKIFRNGVPVNFQRQIRKDLAYVLKVLFKPPPNEDD